jgi:CDP-paratose synthetase
MMKVLVTGATGFLGSHVVEGLLDHNHEVIVVKRSFSNTQRIDHLLSKIVTYNLDECDVEMVCLEHSDIDAVIHTATNYGRNNDKVADIFEANTYFPLRLLEQAIQSNVKMFINTDTILEKFLNAYSLSKKQFAEWGKQLTAHSNTRFINILLEHMYGPGDDASKFSTYVLKNFMNNTPELKFTAGEQKRDFIYIDDVVSAYLLITEKAESIPESYAEYELGSGEAISIRDFVETVHRITESNTKLLFGAIPYRNNEVMDSRAHVEALHQLGWRCGTDLESGIKLMVEKEKGL